MAPSVIKKAVDAVVNFFNDFLNQSSIHGFAYLGNQFLLHLIEKYVLIITQHFIIIR